MDDEILSITGRDIPHIGGADEHDPRLRGLVSSFACLMPALVHRNWFALAFWVIAICPVIVMARPRPARTRLRQVVYLMLLVASAFLVVGVHSTTWRIVGLAIAPIPVVVDVVLARASRSCRQA